MVSPLSGSFSGSLGLGQPTLGKDTVTKLQQAVDTFAGAYTSGADTAKDKAAESSLESSLQSLASEPLDRPGSPAARRHDVTRDRVDSCSGGSVRFHHRSNVGERWFGHLVTPRVGG